MELEADSAQADFWLDSQKAGTILKELEALKSELADFESLEKRLQDLKEIAKISETDNEKMEMDGYILEIEKEINKLEIKTFFSGEYDRNDAIISIHSGAGGVDAQDWAEMLRRMFLRWAEKNGYKTQLLDESKGGEAGIKSSTIEISGTHAYGYLKSEAGVHRLVRLSPYNSDNLRQTSFALVEILPIIDEIKEVLIKSDDLRVDTFRSSGAGGQSVNKTDSAVRITHIPSNIVVSCQSERSQFQNKERAMKILKAKLHKAFLEKQEEEKMKLRGEYHSAEWGSQIRSYVLHPYKLVKDHRTKFESVETEKILDGDLNMFMEAYLKFAAKGR